MIPRCVSVLQAEIRGEGEVAGGEQCARRSTGSTAEGTRSREEAEPAT